MGSSSWSPSSTIAYSTKNAARAHVAREEVFKSRSIKREFDPKYITMRESCDSPANPESTAIILALDVTGSMGMIPEHMARTCLAEMIESIHEKKPVTNPHIMIMGIGDIRGDRAPLQATQFEADIQLSDQLDDIWLEGGGGGNSTESYDFPWIFATHKTDIDCWNKRQKKGYLFTVGDELPPRSGSQDAVNDKLGLKLQASPSPADSLAAAQERYHVFHLLAREGSYCRNQVEKVMAPWKELMGNHALLLSDHHQIASVIVAIMAVNEGAKAEDVIEGIQDPAAKSAVKAALIY